MALFRVRETVYQFETGFLPTKNNTRAFKQVKSIVYDIWGSLRDVYGRKGIKSSHQKKFFRIGVLLCPF